LNRLSRHIGPLVTASCRIVFLILDIYAHHPSTSAWCRWRGHLVAYWEGHGPVEKPIISLWHLVNDAPPRTPELRLRYLANRPELGRARAFGDEARHGNETGSAVPARRAWGEARHGPIVFKWVVLCQRRIGPYRAGSVRSPDIQNMVTFL
jgi:hypothetical protein